LPRFRARKDKDMWRNMQIVIGLRWAGLTVYWATNWAAYGHLSVLGGFFYFHIISFTTL
jgi:hypothetical protein